MLETDSKSALPASDRSLNSDVLEVLNQASLLGTLDDLISPAILVTNAQVQVVWANAGFEQLSGWTLSEILGRQPSEFLHGPDTDREVAIDFLARAHSSEIVLGELLNYRKDGSSFWVSIEARPVLDAAQNLVGHVSIQTDVSQRKILESQWKLEHELLLAICSVQTQFISAGNERVAFDDVLRNLLHLTESSFGFIAEVFLDEDGRSQLHPRAITDVSWDEKSENENRRLQAGRIIYDTLSNLADFVLQHQEPLIANGLQDVFCPEGVSDDCPQLKSFLCLPILDNGRLIAVAGVANRRSGYHVQHSEFLKPLMDTIGQLIVVRYRECQRREMEQSLLATQALLEETGRVAGVGGWELTLPDRKLRWTAQTRLIHEVPSDFEPTVETAIQFYAPQGRQQISMAVEAGLRDGTPWDLEIPFITAKGRRLWVRAKGNVARLNGVPIRLFGTFQDVTERVDRERSERQHRRILELIASRQRLPLIMHKLCVSVESSISDARVMILTSENGREISDSGVGCLPDHLPGLVNGRSLFDEDPLWKLIISHATEGTTSDQSATGDATFGPSGDSSTAMFDVSPTARHYFPITGSQNRTLGALLILQEQQRHFTSRERHAIDEAIHLAGIAIHRWLRDVQLSRSEQLLNEAQQRAKLGSWRLTLQTQELEWSSEVFRLLGRAPDHQPDLQAFFDETVHPDDLPALQMALNHAITNPGNAQSIDIRCRLPDGSERWMYLEGTASVSPGGQILLRGIIQDVDDRKRADLERSSLQAQLLQAQKIESIGRLAGGIAHDFNNMLAVILGHSEVALIDTAVSEQQQKHLHAIKRAGERSAELTRQLLTFARRQAAVPQVLDLNESIVQMLMMLERLIGRNIELVWKPGRHSVKVCIDPVQMDQVVANLVVNARDAISDTGRIVITTARQFVHSPPLTGANSSLPGRYVVLKIADNGCGIAPEAIDHLFEPFFTTKPVGEGTGLGLATVFGIVQQNKGFIEVDSRSTRGTTFSIFLPWHGSDSPNDASDESTPESRPKPGGKALLVDDNAEFAQIVQIYLQHLGFEVFTASRPSEAISTFQSRNHEIDLLITDIEMSDMNGWDLFSLLRQTNPSLPCLFMSGNAEGGRMLLDTFSDNVDFLHKPFSIRDFGHALGRIRGHQKRRDDAPHAEDQEPAANGSQAFAE